MQRRRVQSRSVGAAWNGRSYQCGNGRWDRPFLDDGLKTAHLGNDNPCIVGRSLDFAVVSLGVMLVLMHRTVVMPVRMVRVECVEKYVGSQGTESPKKQGKGHGE